MPAFGFGRPPAMLTGIYAAQDPAGIGHYADLVKRLKASYRSSLVIRRPMERLDNRKLDLPVALFRTPAAVTS